MSSLLTQAKDFEQKSKEQQQLTERELKSAFSAHVRSVNAELSESAKKIGHAIRAHEQNMEEAMSRSRESVITQAMRTWLYVVLTTLLLVATSSGVMWWQGNRIADNARELSRQQDALQRMNAKTWGVSYHEDQDGRFLVLPAGTRADMNWTMYGGKQHAVKLVTE